MRRSDVALRARARSALGRIVVAGGLPWLVRAGWQGRRVTILVYHRPSTRTMAEHLAFLTRHYRIVPLRDAVEAVREAGIQTLPRRSLVITFDDGDRSNRELTELFARHGVPATVFVCSGIVGTRRRFWFRYVPSVAELVRVPDRERLRRLDALGFSAELEASEREALSVEEIGLMRRAGFEFQSHTVSHPILPRCDAEKAALEIGGSKDELESRLGLDIFALAYPNGDYSDRECELARRAGYACAVTVDAGLNSNETDPYRLKRFPIGDSDTVAVLAAKATGIWFLVGMLLGRRLHGYHSDVSSSRKSARLMPRKRSRASRNSNSRSL